MAPRRSAHTHFHMCSFLPWPLNTSQSVKSKQKLPIARHSKHNACLLCIGCVVRSKGSTMAPSYTYILLGFAHVCHLFYDAGETSHSSLYVQLQNENFYTSRYENGHWIRSGLCPKDEVGYLLCQNSTAQEEEKGGWPAHVPTDGHNHFQSPDNSPRLRTNRRLVTQAHPISSWLPQLEKLAHHKLRIYLQTPLLVHA